MKFIIYKATLNSIKLCILFCFVVAPIKTNAQNITVDGVSLNNPPPRIIRACCTFGYDVKLWGVPFIKVDQVISIDELGEHHYLGNSREGTGTIYTNRGGFIDMGHVRDQIDWTRFLYATILNSRGKSEVILPLRNEAGRKTLYLNVPAQFTKSDCIQLAGKITYDLSLWHEISTWFGASTIPLISEKFSSFSVEDVYSNLMGIHVGMKTLHSKLPFNEAATLNIAATLDSLAVVKTSQETYDAYDAVNHKWYTNKKRIPSAKITLKRDPDVLTLSRPWIVPNQTNNIVSPIILEVPLLNAKGESLTSFYTFTIDLNRKIPVEEIFPDRESRLINQDDFSILLDRITNDIQIIEQNTLAKKGIEY